MPATETQLVGGNFQDSLGNPLANGYLKMHLSQDCTVSGVGNICSGVDIKINLDANGNAVSGQSVWSNQVMSPQNNYYRVWGYTAAGQIAWGPNNQQVASGATFNLDLWVPNTVISWFPTIAQPNPPLLIEVNGVPTSSQTTANFESSNSSVAITDLGGGIINLEASGGPAFDTAGDGGFWGPGIVLDDFAMATLANSSTNLSPTSGLVFGFQFVLESEWTIRRCSTYLEVSSFFGQNFSFGIYDAVGTRVIDSGAFICVGNLPAADTVLTNTFSSVTLPPGTYYFVQSTWTIHNLTCSVNALGATNSITAQVYNANGLRTVVATNTYDGTSLPATLGTLTGVLGGVGLINCAAPFWEP